MATPDRGQYESAAAEAEVLTKGSRGADYGHPLDDFERVAHLWEPIVERYWSPVTRTLDWRAVPLFMMQVKISRELNRPKRDNRVDMAGYAETLNMAEHEEAKRDAAERAFVAGAKGG